MTYEQMLLKNIEIYRRFYDNNCSSLKYPNEYLVRFYYHYLRNNILPNSKVLDFGYGGGNNSIFLIEQGYEVYGLESSPSTQKLLVDNLRAHRLNVSLADNFTISDNEFEAMPYKDGMFDFILANLVLYYYPSADSIRKVCTEMLRCLRPGGTVFFTMCGVRSCIFQEAQPTETECIYKVPGKDSRSALDGQYLYLISNEAHLESLFSIFDRVSIGYVEEELFGRRDFIWIYVGRKAG